MTAGSVGANRVYAVDHRSDDHRRFPHGRAPVLQGGQAGRCARARLLWRPSAASANPGLFWSNTGSKGLTRGGPDAGKRANRCASLEQPALRPFARALRSGTAPSRSCHTCRSSTASSKSRSPKSSSGSTWPTGRYESRGERTKAGQGAHEGGARGRTKAARWAHEDGAGDPGSPGKGPAGARLIYSHQPRNDRRRSGGPGDHLLIRQL